MKIKFKYIPDSKNLLKEIETQDICTIKDLKVKISENQDFNIKNIKIIFLGKVLEDTQIINDCDIENDSTFHVVIRKNKDKTNMPNTNTEQYNNQNNTNIFSNTENVFNQINENFQNEEFQSNVSSLLNTMGQLQQNLQNTVQSEQFQNTMNNLSEHLQNTVQSEQFQNNVTNTMNTLSQTLQNTIQSEQFQNNITNTMNTFSQNLQNTSQNYQNSNEYNEEQENKINILLNLNIINDRQQIINLLEDNDWDEETVANTLLYYSV